ncbi:MAG: hypothetical protein Q8N47_01330, partial [Bryobacterales bacterium]|nr:hypothetical protein [Bryobacterales bacterium]
RVSTMPSGAQYYVDGQAYFSPQVFLWPAGSKHVLSVEPPVQTGVRFGERHTFAGWTDSTGRLTAAGPTISITAHPEIASFTAGITVDYQVTVRVVDCPVSENSRCDSPGTAMVGGTPFDRDGSMYVTPNTVLTLAAFPKPGYVFAGWQLGAGSSDAFLSSVTVTGPMSVQPRFEPAKAVTFLTSPPDLQVLADRQPLMTPVTVDWGQGTRHVIGAPSPQDDLTGHPWVFDSWTHGGGQNSLYTVDKTNVRETLTATFVPGARIYLVTNPAGLKLSIDGRANLLSYAFIWGVGTTHAISALDGQTDAAGRRYVFKSWSNGGAAVQQYTVPKEAAADGLRLTANFEALNRVTVQSVPPGLALPIDGVECRTPCTLERRSGASIRVAAPLSIPAGNGTRLDFEGWADGGSPERSWTFDSDSRTLVARYKTLHRLAALVEPEGGAGIRIEPSSTDAFYPEGAAVQVAAEPRPGFRFRAWDGDLSGPYRSGVLSMAGPKAVRALLDRVPFVAETGVRNAAGETPSTGVAAGSLVAILGASLAPAYEVGPRSPLAQSIAGVTVRVDGRMLPLLFVSPEQINAQLPSDIEEGERTLTVRWEGQPEATAVFTVVRNAPGLFAVAAHADGSPVTAENPARAGETLSVFGAGFGPYLRQPPYGFAVPDAPAFPLADPVEVLAGDAVIEPLFSGAAPGQVGTVVTRFRLPDSLAGPALALRVRVNGQDSNTINLPIQ